MTSPLDPIVPPRTPDGREAGEQLATPSAASPLRYPFPPPYGAVSPEAMTQAPTLAASDATLQKRRRVPAWVVWTAAAVVVLGAAGIGVGMWWSSTAEQYAEADATYDEAFASVTSAVNDLRERTLDEEGEQASAQRIIDAATSTSGLVAAETVDVLEVATGELTFSIDAATSVVEGTPDELPDEELTWPWEYTGATGERARATADAEEHEASVDAAATEFAAAQQALREATGGVFESVAASAPVLETENVSARREDVIAFRSAVDLVSSDSPTTSLSPLSADFFEGYATATARLRTSAADELAQKAGPLFDRRMEIEAFARSLSGGVLLDFDWAETVNEAGPDGRVGGTASWDGRAGGSATITLSNSVAERWPEDIPKALVAHEVGHAMAGRCYDMFDWESREENEAWATAWALSMGYTADGNGVSIYGYPRQELIDIAATCR